MVGVTVRAADQPDPIEQSHRWIDEWISRHSYRECERLKLPTSKKNESNIFLKGDDSDSDSQTVLKWVDR